MATTYTPKSIIGSIFGFTGDTGPQGEFGSTGIQGIQGQTGEPGAISSKCYEYVFDSSTVVADPGVGDVRLNNANVESATILSINDTDSLSDDISEFLTAIANGTSSIPGHVKVSSKPTPANFVFYAINSVTDQTGWWELSISFISGDSGSIFSNAEVYVMKLLISCGV